jgi:nucleoside-diphosphate-sugar epimerase
LGLDRMLSPEAGRSSVEVDLLDFGLLERLFEGADGLIHLARVPFPYASSGYDAERRVWKKPDTRGDAGRFSVNVAMTNNVLAAAAALGVKRVVMGSSFAVYGLYYPSRPMMPRYLPIDEVHPRQPDDAYGLTKLIGENLADAYVSRGTGQVASLRFPGVSPADAAAIVAKRADPMARGIAGLWTYIDVRDAAESCRLALEQTLDGHEAFNICAPMTFMNVPTAELIRSYLPDVRNMQHADSGNWAGYDTRKARERLNFMARHVL